jgi:diadenosine tetraphosphate (Ap4A) HIT family hydrolase
MFCADILLFQRTNVCHHDKLQEVPFIRLDLTVSLHREHCPFCRVAAERVVDESALTLTIRDTFPVSPGHTLVIPKRHFAGLFEATADEIAEIWQALRLAAGDLSANHGPDGFNVGVNVGVAAGQTVMHLHVHLIPRYESDQVDPRGGIRRIFPELADYWSTKER